MTLEEAKKIAADPFAGHGRTAVKMAFETLLRALGEPTPEDREAAGWIAEQAKCADQNYALGWPGYDVTAARYRRAADALSRSPAAIRWAALGEAATAAWSRADSYVGGTSRTTAVDVASAIDAIRALDGGALTTENKIITPPRSMIPDSTCQCGHPADKHIECVEFTSARGCFADDCDCTHHQSTMREVILPEGWSQGTPVASHLEAPYEWYRKPPSGRWLYVRRQADGVFTWHVWSTKPQKPGTSARVLASARASTPELAMDAADTADRIAG